MPCSLCKEEKLLSASLGICRDCILNKWEEARAIAALAHRELRRKLGLVEVVPRRGIPCNFCQNRCKIAKGQLGYCGIKMNKDGKLVHLAGDFEKGLLEYYFDPLPTNCVSAWCCEERNAKSGYNLAVFYGACSFDCLFCQNWHFKHLTTSLSPIVKSEELARAVNEETKCICFFGGDPTPQLMHAIEVAKLVVENDLKVRICLETNGSANWHLLKRFASFVLETRGTIKFDLKFWHEELNLAICGASNKWTLSNFERLSRFIGEEESYAFLTASTLLIPGYVNEEEIKKIASFIASLNERIPYSLLAFYPCHEFADLPRTSRELAIRCYKAARDAGLKNVRIGNVHLLI